MKWLPLALLPALAVAGGFGNSIFSSSAAGSSGGGGSTAKSIVGYGDSIMSGTGGGSPLPPAVTALGAGAFSVNAGVPGDSSGGIAARYTSGEATACGAVRCTHLWLEGGTNDLRAVSPAPPAAVVANMTGVVDDALSKGYVVVWSDVLPCRGYVDASDAIAASILVYNAAMQAACTARAANNRLRCVFAYSAFEDPERPGYLLPAYSFDELHLSVAGAATLGALAAAVLP